MKLKNVIILSMMCIAVVACTEKKAENVFNPRSNQVSTKAITPDLPMRIYCTGTCNSDPCFVEAIENDDHTFNHFRCSCSAPNCQLKKEPIDNLRPNPFDLNYLFDKAITYCVKKYDCERSDVGFAQIIQRPGTTTAELQLELVINVNGERFKDALVFKAIFTDETQKELKQLLAFSCDSKDGMENHCFINEQGTISNSCPECGITQTPLKPEAWNVDPNAWEKLCADSK